MSVSQLNSGEGDSFHPCQVCRGGRISETGCPLEMPRCLRPKLSIPNQKIIISPAIHRSKRTVQKNIKSFQLKHIDNPNRHRSHNPVTRHYSLPRCKASGAQFLLFPYFFPLSLSLSFCFFFFLLSLYCSCCTTDNTTRVGTSTLIWSAFWREGRGDLRGGTRERVGARRLRRGDEIRIPAQIFRACAWKISNQLSPRRYPRI